MLKLLILATLVGFVVSSDFENAHVLDQLEPDFEGGSWLSGVPRLKCTRSHVSVTFETSVPFQGRVAVHRKRQPVCHAEFAANIHRNASFSFPLSHCAETTYMTNGSRAMSAHLEISFHPTVITNSDRLFFLQCIDDSTALVVRHDSETEQCVHTVRPASQLQPATVFHVGDSVIHEWKCGFPNREALTYSTLLAYCKAVSRSGDTAHLIDENGCVVDSELLGEVVYQGNSVLIYSRARMFKFQHDDKLRFECVIQMCKKAGGCQDATLPPKCSITKEEITRRYEAKGKRIAAEDHFRTESLKDSEVFEKRVRVSSEWLTVYDNDYISTARIPDFYNLRCMMDQVEGDPNPENGTSEHFLKAISFREKPLERPAPATTSRPSVDSRRISGVRAPTVDLGESLVSDDAPVISAPIFTTPPTTFGRHSNVGSAFDLVSVASEAPEIDSSSTEENSSTSIEESTSARSRTRQPPMAPQRFAFFTEMQGTSARPRTQHTTARFEETTVHVVSIEMSSTETSHQTPTKPFQRAKVKAKGPLTTTSTEATSTRSEEVNRFSSDEEEEEDGERVDEAAMATERSEVDEAMRNAIGDAIVEDFEKRRDWRLDDIRANDTVNEHQELQACNRTTEKTEFRCEFTGFHQALFVWAVGSLLIWIILFAVFCYRACLKLANQPSWVREEERRRRAAQAVRLESPTGRSWLHPDAFEEPRSQISKHEVDLRKF